MKNILLSFITAIIVFSSCNRGEVELLYDKPNDERVADTLNYLKSTLASSENGWFGYTSTNKSGSYSFYIDFKQNDRLEMLSDLNNVSAQEARESTYRIRQIMSATLSFDTYNYITMLQDPAPSTVGGVAGKGLESDIEFEYQYSDGDTVVFKGRRFKNDLKLVKVDNEQKQRFYNGELVNAIEEIQEFFIENSNPYLEINGLKYQISLNFSNKTSESTVIDANNEVVSKSGEFFYDLEGVQFPGGLSFGSTVITRLTWKDGDLYGISLSDESILIQNSLEPIMPLHLLMGKKYNGLYTPFKGYFPGNSSTGLGILQRYHEGLGSGATGFVFNCGDLTLEWNLVNERIRIIGFSSQNGCVSGWETVCTYQYELDEATGTYSLSMLSSPQGGYTGAILDELLDFFNTSSFKLDYFVDGANLYGQIIGIERSDVAMTFQLR